MGEATELELAFEEMNEAIRIRREAIKQYCEAFECYREIYENPPHKLIARSIKGLFSKNKK